MTLKSLLAVVMCSAALVGCGSGDGGSNGAYSINEYKGRSVSSNSLLGTWVSVSSSDLEATGKGDYIGYRHQESYNNKEFFAIIEIENQLYKTDCTYGRIPLEVSGNSIKYSEDDVLTITNNSTFIGSGSEQYSDDEGSGSFNWSVEAVKVSDSTANFVTLSLNRTDGYSNSGLLDCVEVSNYSKSGSNPEEGSYIYKEEQVITWPIEFINVDYGDGDGYVALESFVSDLSDYDTDFGDSVSFSVESNEEVINFSATDESSTLTGVISVNFF